MKAFIAHPLNLETNPSQIYTSEKAPLHLIASYYDLFRQVKLLNGSIVKCGVSDSDCFNRFSLFRTLMGAPVVHKMVAFEKVRPTEKGHGETEMHAAKMKMHAVQTENTSSSLFNTALKEQINFIPGYICDTIPDYLIENPEERLALLDLDTTDYESTLTALEFLYPRLVQGGLLLLDYYAPGQTYPNAVNDYFAPGKVVVHNFSGTQGIYYIIKE